MVSLADSITAKDNITRPVIIVGLRRSGTTVLWEALRSHSGLVAFDEPFHPRLWEGARESTKGTWTELTSLWHEAPTELAADAQPIHPFDELDQLFNCGQAAYLSALLSQNNSKVVIDVVRGWNKIEAVASVTPEPYIVQLVRSPVAWVLSHLLPSGNGSWRKPIGDILRRWTALRRRGWYDNWQYETIINQAIAVGHPLWSHVPIAPERLLKAPAHLKLLAFWWAANRIMAGTLEKVASSRHHILLAEDFMGSPDECLSTLLESAGLPAADLDTSAVRPARSDPLQDSTAFRQAFEALGITRALLPASRPNSEAIAAALLEGSGV